MELDTVIQKKFTLLKVIRYYPGFLYSLSFKPFLTLSPRNQKLGLSKGNA